MVEDYFNLDAWLNRLHDLHPALALGLVAASVVFLARGWKYYKYLVVLDALIAGAFVGALIGARTGRPHMDIYLAAGLAIIFAVTAWPLMKYAVCVLGGVAGAAFGCVLWYCGAQALGYANMAQEAWVGALVGLIILAMLTFIAFQTTVILGLGLQGALMLVFGAFSLMFRVNGLEQPLNDHIAANSFFVPLMIFIPGAVGIIYQHSQAYAGGKKKAGGGEKKPAAA